MRYADWGERSPRWTGIRSATVDVSGAAVHLLRIDAAATAPPDAPTQLLVHPMAAGAVFWLDVMPALAAFGPVVAPDLPGAVLGETAAAHRNAARAEPGAEFLCALTAALDMERTTLHGWSFGGLIAVLFAELRPALVSRVILTDPALPGPLTRAERLGWATVGRAALRLGPPLTSLLLAVAGPALVERKRRRLTGHGALDLAGGDPSRVDPELIAVVDETLGELSATPRRLRDGVVAFGSALSSMYVDRGPALRAIDRLDAPTLLLWGDDDPLVERRAIDDLLARHPDWALHVFESVGHLPPWEVPEEYARIVGCWLDG
ncbi:alpha/beta fold hydrolase [Nocardia lijiangensis]|uniref:alpha/beta fold hydrolase n=1 Tax=Nocardia lijiangensis TaxID=299618 RepID=UPI00082EE9F3|nr:alpha/beta hydrolase [Nocardia lijiangensis]